MIRCFTEYILSFIRKNTDIPEREAELYKYGIEITLSSILNIMIVIIMSIILGDILLGVCFLFSFILLRQFSGGYHAESYFRCNLVLAVSYFAVALGSKVLNSIPIHIFECMIILGAIIIILYTPVNNRHKYLTADNKARCRKLSIVIYSVLGVISVILKTLNIYYGSVILLTLLLVVLMIAIEIYLQKGGYHEG